MKIIKYEKLDQGILRAIADQQSRAVGPNLITIFMAVKKEANEVVTGEKPNRYGAAATGSRIVERRLQALRKAGKIEYFVKDGWRIAVPEELSMLRNMETHIRVASQHGDLRGTDTGAQMLRLLKKLDEVRAKNTGVAPAYSEFQNFNKEAADAIEVMHLLDTCEWKLTRVLPWSALTDEANAESAWSVERQTRPFCNKKNERIWVGRTAIDALRNAVEAMKGVK